MLFTMASYYGLKNDDLSSGPKNSWGHREKTGVDYIEYESDMRFDDHTSISA